MKTLLMLLGLAGVFAAGTACFGLFIPRSDRSEDPTAEACEGLSGEAKADCERRHER
ncbi:MAG: hypothetical protein ACREF4_13375 [Gammaproteobacteria bacterium]